MKIIISLLLVLGLSSCASGTERYVSVVRKTLPKTVTIYVTYTQLDTETGMLTQNRVMGAGVFVSSNGHVLTVAHLFGKGRNITSVTVENYNGEQMAGELLYKQENRDLAILKTEYEDTPFVKIADPRYLQVGQEVLAIGAPLGYTFSVSNGIISALNRDRVMYNSLQTNAAINPGNSGGPLINLSGELVGINSFIVPPVPLAIFTGLGFAVEPGQIIEFLTKFRGLDAVKTFSVPFKRAGRYKIKDIKNLNTAKLSR